MTKKLLFFLFIAAALAVTTLAQTHLPVVRNVSSDDTTLTGLSRPRLASDRTSDVKASVIVNIASVERIAFDMLNQKRAENGLRPLAWSNDLANIARFHSQDMADNKYFSHSSLDGKHVSDRADGAHVGRWRSIGENIAFERGYADPIEKAIQLWLESPGHRRNLMDDNWRESAVGVAVAKDGGYYFTQVFLRR